MELKKLQQQWDKFPEISMEERPILSSDLEKIALKNPLSDAFYLKGKILIRLFAGGILWLLNSWQLRVQWLLNGNDLYQQIVLFGVLSYFIYFQVRLLFFADYATLLSLPLVSFLGKMETILEKYILSFKFISIIAGFYLTTLLQLGLSRVSTRAYDSISGNGWYKWLIIVFLTVTFDIGLLHTIIPRYRRLEAAIRKYQEGISTKPQNK